jgi:glycosyltransferase involved in cell wall biosynthesis
LYQFQKQRPDVIYVATESPMGLAAMLTAKLLGIPVVSGYHTNFTNYLPAYGMDSLVGIGKWYLRWFHNLGALTVAPSRDTISDLEAQKYQNLALMGRGVDADLFSPQRRSAELRAQWGAGMEDRVCLLVGRLAKEKNLPLALEALRTKNGRYHGGNLITVVVGDGPMMEEYQAQYPWAVFLGELSASQLAPCYASADILAFPSRSETFGNVLLESLASGLPPVAFDYAAGRVHVLPGHNGWAVRLNQEDAYPKVLAEAVECPAAVLSELRQAARSSVEEWSWENTAQRFEDLLKTAIQPAIVSAPTWTQNHTPSLAKPGPPNA